MNKQEMLAPYAVVAMAAMQQLLEAERRFHIEKDEHSRKILSKQVGGLKHLVDRCIRITSDFLPANASRRAIEYCDKNQLADIFQIGWGGQLVFEKQSNRSSCTLKHEHKVPISTLIQQLRNATSLEDAVKIFESQEVVWVTKEEDRRLPKSNRPDPDEEYRKADIEVVSNPHTAGHLFEPHR